MKIRNVNVTPEKVKEYYNSYFCGDLNRYFCKETIGGVEYILRRNTEYRSPVIRNKRIPCFVGIAEEERSDKNRIPDGSLTDELIFAGLLFAFYEAQSKQSWNPFQNDRKEMAEFYKALGMPLIKNVFFGSQRRYIRSAFEDFKQDALLYYACDTKEDYDAFREMLEDCFTFVTKLVLNHLRTWNNGVYDDPREHISSPVYYFHHEMADELYSWKREYTFQTGLSGINFTSSAYVEYFNTRFLNHLHKYFHVGEWNKDYLVVPCMHATENKRLYDGKVSDDPQENFFFAVTVLMMILAGQSMSLYAEDHRVDFHKCSGWPMLLSGPGGGDMLNAMYMLEYSGLAPSYNEMFYFLDAWHIASEYLLGIFNSFLNGTTGFMANPELGKEFYMKLDGKKCSIIKRQMKEFVNQIDYVIKEKIGNPKMSWKQHVTELFGGFNLEDCSLKKLKNSKL